MSQIKDLTTTLSIAPASTDWFICETTSGVDQKISYQNLKSFITTDTENNITNNAKIFYAEYMLAGDYDASEMIAGAVLTGTDSAALIAGQIVLRNYSSNKNLNGLWVIQTSGSAIRYTKCNSSYLIYGSLVRVIAGLSTRTTWECTTYPAIFGINDIEYEQKYLPNQALNTDSDVTFDSVVFDDATASTVPYLDLNKKLVSSAVTPTELGYVSGVTSAIQTQLNALTPKYGGFYAYNKSIALNITVQDVYHAFHQVTAADLTQGTLDGFTFNAGRAVNANITSEASGTGGKLRIICSAAHGLTTGDLVVLGSMNNAGHNKPTRITTDSTNPTTEFLCDDINYIAGAGTSAGMVDEPAQLICSAGAAGVYHANFMINATAASANKTFKLELNGNITAFDNVAVEGTSTGSLTSVNCNGNVSLAVGDRLWISVKNITDTSDLTVKNMNLNLHRIKAI